MDNKNDILALAMYNPQASVADLLANGITAENTTIHPEQDYLKYEDVKNNQLFKDNTGNFSPTKFHQFYQGAITNYNVLAQTQPKASKWDIFAPVGSRDWTPQYQVTKIDNPDRVTHSMIEVGKEGPRTMSRQEIAQTQRVWDPETRTYQDAPNDNFFSNLFNTRVMAQWDFDADENGNATNDTTKVVHHKGEYKLNENGTYYYENANGKNIHDKEVLHVSDVLTSDGSAINAIDFLDSDDIQKSAMGSIAKNALLIGSMYLPYVGPAIAGLTVAQQGVKLFSTLGKMLTSSDNKLMNRLEGFAETTNFMGSTSEKAKESPWSWENMINMVGDTMGQLKQQRFLFKKMPALFKGKAGLSEKNQKAMQSSIEKSLNSQNNEILEKNGHRVLEALSNPEAAKARDVALKELMTNNQMKAAQQVQDFMKEYYNLGGIISKTYMVGITTQDMFQEAVNAGASDKVAMAMTLGYTALEAKLLNTNLGEWVLPELRAQKYATKKVLQSMGKNTIKALNESVENTTDTTAKKKLMRKLFDYGKDVFTGSRNIVKDFDETGSFKKTLSANIANGLGEGFEEVSEEVLADVVRVSHDLVNWLTDGKQKDMLNMDGWQTRYAMNFIGGLIGGGTHSVLQNYNTFNTFNNLSSQEAMKYVINEFRQDGGKKLFETLEKTDFGDKNLSTELITDENGVVGYARAEKGYSQNDMIKKAMYNQLKLVQQVLNSSGANLSDKSLLDNATVHQLRYSMLANTTTAGKYIETFTQETDKLVKIQQDIVTLQNNTKDSEKREDNSEYQQTLKELEQKYKEQEKKIKDLAEGKNAFQFMVPAFLEMNPELLKEFNDGMTFETFVQAQTGKSINELTKEERETQLHNYSGFLKTDKKDNVEEASAAYIDLSRKVMDGSMSILDPYIKGQSTSDKFILHLHQSLKTLSNLGVSANEYLNSDTSIGRTGAKEIVNPTIQNLATVIATNYHDSDSQNYLEQTNALVTQYNTIAKDINEDENIKTEEERKIAENNRLDPIQQQLEQLQYNFVDKKLNSLVQEQINKGWVNPITKKYLLDALSEQEKLLNKYPLDPQGDGVDIMTGQIINPEMADWSQQLFKTTDINEAFNIFDEKDKKIKQLKGQLNNIQSSPVVSLLKKFNLDMTGKDIDIETLLNGNENQQGLNSLMDQFKNRLDAFTIEDDSLKQQLHQAIRVTSLLRAIILGMRQDNVGFTLQENFENTERNIATDLFGINSTLNQMHKNAPKMEQDDWIDLPTIDAITADAIINDLNLINKKLHFFLDLNEYNSGSKLIKQPSIAKKTIVNLYNSTKRFIVNVLPDDDEWQKRKSIFDKFWTMDNKIKQSQEQGNNISIEELYKAKIELEDTIYEFMQNLPENTNLIDLLDYSKYNIFDNSQSIISDGDDAKISDTDFLWYFISRGAMKSSDFYAKYREILSNDIAPIPAQEQAVFLNVAATVNGQFISDYSQKLKDKIISELESLSIDDKMKVLANYGIQDGEKARKLADNKYLKKYDKILFGPKFSNIVFTEGAPGTGKTQGVLPIVLDILQDQLKGKIWIANNTKRNADKLASDLGRTDQSKTFSSEELIQFISNYQSPDRDGEILKYERDKHYIVTPENNVEAAINIKTVSDIPSVIVIDEVSRLTDIELDIIDKFAKQHGITVLTFGDLNQIKSSGSLEIPIDGFNAENKIQVSENSTETTKKLSQDLFMIKSTLDSVNLVHTFRLENSLRTANTQSTNNNNIIKTALKRGEGEMKLHYYEEVKSDSYILNGIKYFSNNPEVNIQGVEDTIKNLIKNVKVQPDGSILEEDKIGYIYIDKTTSVYQLISSRYSKYFQLHEGGNSQGLEGDYYVIEIPNKEGSDMEQYISYLYTGASRAKKGSILIAPPTQGGGGKTYTISNVKDEATQDETLSKDGIKAYSQEVKEILSDIQGEELIITPRTTTKASTTVTPPKAKEISFQEGLKKVSKTENSDTIIYSFTTPTSIPDEFRMKYSIGKDYEKIEGIKINKDTGKVTLVINNGNSFNLEIADNIETITNNLITYEKPEELSLNDKILQGLQNNESVVGLLQELINNEKLNISSDKLETLQALLNSKIKNTNTINLLNELKEYAKSLEEPDTSNDELDKSGLQGQKGIKEKVTKGNKTQFKQPIVSNNQQNILYTHSTLELGHYTIIADQNGSRLKPIPGFGSNRDSNRVDAVDGLIHIAEAFDPNFDINKILNNPQLTIRTLSLIQSAAKYATSKEDLNNKIKAALFDLVGTDKIYNTSIESNFFFKSSISYQAASNRTSFDRYRKDFKNETSIYNDIQDDENMNVSRKSISLQIAFGDKGYLFEIPIFTLNSPWTIGQSTDSNGDSLYPNINTIISNYKKRMVNGKFDFFNCAKKIIASPECNQESKYLTNLFKLFIFTQATAVNLDENWLPSQNLNNFGMQFDADANLNQINDKYTPVNFQNLEDLAKRQNVVISPILISRTDKISVVNENGIVSSVDISPKVEGLEGKAGHPFVLISDDLSLYSAEDLIEQYKKQLADNSIVKKVKQVFILPPRVKFGDYLISLRDFNDYNKKGVSPLGNNYTIFNVWKAILNDEKNKAQVESLVVNSFGDITEGQKVWGQIIESLNNIEQAGDYKEGLKILNQQSNWGVGSYGKNTTIERNLIYNLRRLCYEQLVNPNVTTEYSTPNQRNIAILSSFFDNSEYSIYENVKLGDTEIGGFMKAKTEGYSLNGKSFIINNKLSTAAFSDSGYISDFIDDLVNDKIRIKLGPKAGDTIEDLILENANPTDYSLLGLPESTQENYVTRKHVVGFTKPKFEISQKVKDIHERFSYNIQPLDISSRNISSQEELDSIELEYIKNCAEIINRSTEYSQYAFVDSRGNLIISEENPIFEGEIIQISDNNIIIDGVNYEVRIDSSEITLNPLDQTTSQPVELNFNLQDIEVVHFTKDANSPSGIVFSNKLQKIIEHENNPLLSEVETQIIATEDINELRQLAVQKVKIMVDTLKQYIAKKPTSKNSIIKGIQGSSETVEQIKNYLNNSETEEDLSCKSIIVNIE